MPLCPLGRLPGYLMTQLLLYQIQGMVSISGQRNMLATKIGRSFPTLSYGSILVWLLGGGQGHTGKGVRGKMQTMWLHSVIPYACYSPNQKQCNWYSSKYQQQQLEHKRPVLHLKYSKSLLWSQHTTIVKIRQCILFFCNPCYMLSKALKLD